MIILQRRCGQRLRQRIYGVRQAQIHKTVGLVVGICSCDCDGSGSGLESISGRGATIIFISHNHHRRVVPRRPTSHIAYIPPLQLFKTMSTDLNELDADVSGFLLSLVLTLILSFR